MNITPENVVAELNRVHEVLRLIRGEFGQWLKKDFTVLGFNAMRVWYCVRAMHGMDEQFSADLEKQGYETFLPITFTKEVAGERTFADPKLRFSPYLFVAVDHSRQSFHPITETLGYEDVLRLNVAEVDGNRALVPSVVPYDVILGMKQDMHEDFRACRFKVRPNESLYRARDIVRVLRDGPFKDQEYPIEEIRSNAVVLDTGAWPLRLKEGEIVAVDQGLLKRRAVERAETDRIAAAARAEKRARAAA